MDPVLDPAAEIAKQWAELAIAGEEAKTGATLSIVQTTEDENGWEFMVCANGDPDSLESYYIYVDGSNEVSQGPYPFITEALGPEVNMFGPHSTEGLTPDPVQFQ